YFLSLVCKSLSGEAIDTGNRRPRWKQHTKLRSSNSVQNRPSLITIACVPFRRDLVIISEKGFGRYTTSTT
ncbi:MAG: hypothetical protein LUP99_05290, partial [Methanomicrobiales archaeon]|nr:hypothetical protein [Methanomicrobiales archaeon]